MCDLIRVKQMDLVIRAVENNSTDTDREIAIALLAELVTSCLNEHQQESQRTA
ncbi:hypothetical protein K5M76_06550 [Shewanella xiamenensis]|uniref:hypothetical protein n=1 Tax=Shewanella xiamenensis TaxID=332186 RepID=UPI001594B8EB|nr:hypothetical protein [Shewanella xiamenensis]MCT8858336.1 hypothetical protein [Shewanella xiamenensis]QXN26710.1 hypothetical protein KVP08_009205 [Shewanella putrefaciens]UWG65882.1 hypothetical protein K5M76_06550 [Shewanella xiamenensis]